MQINVYLIYPRHEYRKHRESINQLACFGIQERTDSAFHLTRLRF